MHFTIEFVGKNLKSYKYYQEAQSWHKVNKIFHEFVDQTLDQIFIKDILFMTYLHKSFQTKLHT